MARAIFDLVSRHLVEKKDNLEMRKIAEPCKGI
jgi:hypothetical protein